MKLHLAEGLNLPLEVVTQKLAWLGVTGSGKTYGASKLAELLWHAGAQIVVLDPVGVWYGVRLAKNGKKPSAITIPIFGGLHADVPLEPTAGALIANLVVDKALSAILDVSQFESDADKARFARDFADRFFFRKKAAPSAVHLFLEECQEFVPQNPQSDEARMLHAFTRLQKLGRNFGVGSSYISQRPQEVNKKALNMAQTLFVFRTTGTQERTAIEKWIEDKALDEDIAGDLPKIATGHCHVWSPEFLKISETVHILEKETFNASATPEVGAAAVTRELAPIDLERVRTDMAATIERAKADDPRELRRQIAELKKQAAAGTKIVPDRHKESSKPLLTDADRALLERLASRVSEQVKHATETIAAAESRADRVVQTAVAEYLNTTRNVGHETASNVEALFDRIGIRKILEKLSTMPAPAPRTSPSRPAPAPATRQAGSRPTLPPRDRGADDASLPPGELATLTAALQYPGLDKKRLGVLTGYKRSSRDAYVARLAQKELVDVRGSQLYPTDAGRAALNGSFQPLPTGADLVEYWRARLPEGERKTLEVLLAGDETAREAIDEATGYKRSSRDAYLTRLKARGLVEFTARGMVRASEELFR